MFSEIVNWASGNADITNTIALLGGIVTSSLALLISALSVFVSVRNSRQQRDYNTLSVRPVPEITVADYEESIRVTLRNFGNGPLLIRELRAVRDGNTERSLIEHMPDKIPFNHSWTHYSNDLAERSIRVNGEIILLQIDGTPGAGRFDYTRDRVRYALHNIVIELDFKDIQGNSFPTYRKSLEWFGRNLSKDKEGKQEFPTL